MGVKRMMRTPSRNEDPRLVERLKRASSLSASAALVATIERLEARIEHLESLVLRPTEEVPAESIEAKSEAY
jgi:hypothetical protein